MHKKNRRSQDDAGRNMCRKLQITTIKETLAKLVVAGRDGNQKAAADAKRRWFVNGEEIAE